MMAALVGAFAAHAAPGAAHRRVRVIACSGGSAIACGKTSQIRLLPADRVLEDYFAGEERRPVPVPDWAVVVRAVEYSSVVRRMFRILYMAASAHCRTPRSHSWASCCTPLRPPTSSRRDNRASRAEVGLFCKRQQITSLRESQFAGTNPPTSLIFPDTRFAHRFVAACSVHFSDTYSGSGASGDAPLALPGWPGNSSIGHPPSTLVPVHAASPARPARFGIAPLASGFRALTADRRSSRGAGAIPVRRVHHLVIRGGGGCHTLHRAGHHRRASISTFRITPSRRRGGFTVPLLGYRRLHSELFRKGPLWWVIHHRLHHKHSDTSNDPHSPVVDGFIHGHMGWLFTRDMTKPDERLVRDLAKYPELVWLDRLWVIPGLLLAAACYAVLGYGTGMIYGYCG